ncbi:jasmonate-induced oxygenase 4-like [Andrographis paniculata]|uniref:jasmonate-induced oxygenase 4-like n=1 Tax=Andrographis paniculata TaxID=175694 RepID=UPI0021E830EB|nr:jasmonate-induced oxygenase 4-like [Andrographis paniculata]
MAESPSPSSPPIFSAGQPQQQDKGDPLIPPRRYVWTDSGGYGYGPLDLAGVPSATDIPVFDFAQLQFDQNLHTLRRALTSWGCFQVVNHGIEVSLLEKLRNLSREFFHLPTNEKQKCARSSDGYEGYGSDPVLFENQSVDWNNRLYLLVLPQDDRKLKYWPENPKSFRDTLIEYTNRVRRVQDELLKAMAKSLGLQDDCFVKQFGERPTIYARFNYYRPCAWPDKVLGLKPHADGSGITVLLQDEDLEGLQVLKDDRWLQVQTLPHALLVNVGDQIEIMSNGIFKSPVHRAITNSDKERNTLVMFCSPDPTQEIEPVEELVSESQPRLFKKVRGYDRIFFQHYQQGKRPLDAVRI